MEYTGQPGTVNRFWGRNNCPLEAKELELNNKIQRRPLRIKSKFSHLLVNRYSKINSKRGRKIYLENFGGIRLERTRVRVVSKIKEESDLREDIFSQVIPNEKNVRKVRDEALNRFSEIFHKYYDSNESSRLKSANMFQGSLRSSNGESVLGNSKRLLWSQPNVKTMSRLQDFNNFGGPILEIEHCVPDKNCIQLDEPSSSELKTNFLTTDTNDKVDCESKESDKENESAGPVKKKPRKSKQRLCNSLITRSSSRKGVDKLNKSMNHKKLMDQSKSLPHSPRMREKLFSELKKAAAELNSPAKRLMRSPRSHRCTVVGKDLESKEVLNDRKEL